MVGDDNFIPYSARIEFTLMVSKEAEEDQEYKYLLNETNTIIRDCRKSLKLSNCICDNINAQINTSGALQQNIEEEMVENDTIANIRTQEHSQSSTTSTFNDFLFTMAGQVPATITAPAPTCTLLNNYPCPNNTYMTNRTTPASDEKYARISFQTFYSKLAEPLLLAFLNTFVFSWGQFKVHTEADNICLHLKNYQKSTLLLVHQKMLL
eukprot:10543937-Ditylum_brightwellii.AAC.1